MVTGQNKTMDVILFAFHRDTVAQNPMKIFFRCSIQTRGGCTYFGDQIWAVKYLHLSGSVVISFAHPQEIIIEYLLSNKLFVGLLLHFAY